MAQTRPPAQRRPYASRLRYAALVLLVVLCAGLALAPRFVRGYLALQWTRHLVARNETAPRVGDARPTGRWAAQAIDGLCPLPQAWESARLVLDFARRLRPKDAAAARALVTPVRLALERAESSWVGGYGMGSLREEAWQVENTLLIDTDAGVQP